MVIKKDGDKSMLKKTKNIVLWVILGVVLLELILRLCGFAWFAWNNYENRFEDSGNSSYSILCLGESTTANLYSNKNSWPAQLEIILNNRSSEIKFRVFNEGFGGTNTAFILSHLEDNLDKYKPDMVITMMGMNDVELNIQYKGVVRIKTNLFFKNLRVYKLSKLLFAALKSNTQSKIKNAGIVKENISIQEEYQLEAERYVKLGENYQEENNFKEAEEMFKKAIELYPNGPSLVYLDLGQVYYNQEKLKEAENMFVQFIKINPNSDEGYYNLGRVYNKQGISSKKIEEFYKKNGFSFGVVEGSPNHNITKYHYHQLYKELNKRGIKYIAMQYPSLGINDLKSMFEGNENITFVSNEENFKKTLETGKYEDYFVDKCGGNFGHATLKGNKLIAENVANVILTYLKSED